MTHTPVASDIHQPSYVLIDFALQVALDHLLSLDDLPDAAKVPVVQVPYVRISEDAGLVDYVFGLVRADAEDPGERDLHAFIVGDVYP